MIIAFTRGALALASISMVALCGPVQAKQPPANAYDHSVGHFGSKNVKPPYLTYADDGTGRKNVTLMAQIPDRFDPKKPCIVTATSSGSRGVYGAIGASGEWGLKQGCAVAYTDKGTGNGLHDLMTDSVGLIDGARTDAATAGKTSIFTAAVSDADRAAFNADTPNRVAYQHAHSQQNRIVSASSTASRSPNPMPNPPC